MKLLNPKMQHKFTEALTAVLPIVVIVLVLSFSFAPISPSILLSFLFGAVMVMVGMMFFTLGAEMSMTPMGEKIGARMTQSRKVWLIVILSFVLGVIITVSEPDLQVLAQLVPSIPNHVLILAVAVGVGLFLVVAIVRMLLNIPLRTLLVFLYVVAFALLFLVPADFRAISFDSGGVASGPMTATFLLPLAQGACTAVGGNLASDAFGVVAMVAMTPLITIQIMGVVHSIRNRRHEQSVVITSELDWAIIEL